MDDALIRFSFPDFAARGALVRLRQSWHQMTERRNYPPLACNWLGEASAASVLLGSHLQQAASVAVQLQGSHALRLLFAECSNQDDALGIRGLLRTEGTEEVPRSFSELVEQATLAVTITPAAQGQRYQGIVAADGDSLGKCLEGYFEQSEQLPTRLLLAADQQLACGLLLQRIPGQGGLRLAPAGDDDGWQRINHLLDTLSMPELLSTPADTLLHRLFHEESVLQQPPVPVGFRCTCSRERVAQMLRSLGYRESLEALRESEGERITVHCEFCDHHYGFDAVDIEALFATSHPAAASPRIQ